MRIREFLKKKGGGGRLYTLITFHAIGVTSGSLETRKVFV